MDPEIEQATPRHDDFWTQGLDRQFTSRVYGRTLQVGVLGILLMLGFDQKPAALGLAAGLAVGLFSLWTVEATVRLMFGGGSFAGAKLAVAAFLKMPFLLGGLVGVAWCAMNGVMNIFAVVGGVLLVHCVMLAMVLARAMAAEHSNRERFR